MKPLSASAKRVQSALDAAGIKASVREHESPARTASEASALLGCDLAQITKSLIFRGQNSGKPVLILASGANRVDTGKVAAIVGEPVGKADAALTREVTGYAIGGIPPLGHVTAILTLFDQDLLAYASVFPAGGTPHAMFEVEPQALLRATGATLADVRLDVAAAGESRVVRTGG
jgi:prolyl-tRNA editing enzyme YbaK/EbsC (Cys-tRNA(Pro) deacylase)